MDSFEPQGTLTIEAALREEGWLRSLARRLVGEGTDVEDAVQATWEATLRDRPLAAQRRRAWLSTVLKNHVRQAARTRVRRLDREERAARPERAPDTAELVAEADLRAAVASAVLALPDLEREAVLLRYYRDLSLAELAGQVGASEATVKRRLAAGVARLRRALEERDRAADGRLLPALVAFARVPEESMVAAAPGVGALGWVALVAVCVSALVWGPGLWSAGADEDPAGEALSELEPRVLEPRARPSAADREGLGVEPRRSAVSIPNAASGAEAHSTVAGEAVDSEGFLVELRFEGQPVSAPARVVVLDRDFDRPTGVTSLGGGRYAIQPVGRAELVVHAFTPGFDFASVSLEPASLETWGRPVLPLELGRRARLVEVRALDATGEAIDSIPTLLQPVVHSTPPASFDPLGEDFPQVTRAYRSPLRYRVASGYSQAALASKGGVGWVEVLGDGPAWVSLTLQGRHLQTQPLPPGEHEVLFVMESGQLEQSKARLRGQVVDTAGRPLPEVRVGLLSNGSNRTRSATTWTDVAGEFEVELYPGAWRLTVHGPHGSQNFGEYELDSDDQRHLGQLVHRPGRVVKGAVEVAAKERLSVRRIPLDDEPTQEFGSGLRFLSDAADVVSGQYQLTTWADSLAIVLSDLSGTPRSAPVRIDFGHLEQVEVS
ncbi:MAG: sigma-70 family RNA polymerase sigma factor, partial [Planctomycetota bacterium]